jgi:hypothetical protein
MTVSWSDDHRERLPFAVMRGMLGARRLLVSGRISQPLLMRSVAPTSAIRHRTSG